MRDEYQRDGVGLGPLHELVDLNFNWTLQLLKKHLYHSCRKDVVLKLFLLSTVMTFVTTTLTRLYKVG